jgi:endoglucanase
MVDGICRLGKHGLLIVVLLALGPAGGCRESAWPLWEAYRAHFIDAQGRVIDHSSGDRTTSEGQAYALFFALAADDRSTFDRLLNWTQANMASGSLAGHLPGWLWARAPDGRWKQLDANPAADADAWMAYALVEAGRLWKAPAYTTLGRSMMAEIAKSEVASLPGFGPMLLPGPVGFQHGQTTTLNPSYLPVFLFERLAAEDPAGPWRQIAQGIPRLLEESARHGYAMDWINYIPGDGFYPAPPIETGNKDSETAGGSYDAIRVYLWAGMIGGGTLRSRVLSAVPAMSVYLANHDAPPEKVSDQGIPLAQDGPVGFSAAVLTYLRAFPHATPAGDRQMVRLMKARDASTGLYGKDLAYYDQNLALFATGFIDGRFRFDAGGELNVEWKR